ncbi:BolA/IbaG family iron-sulfur metabolism protein [Myxococcota bacterium]|nr:BolA/IbaG family iron-sulfur metabolism protein [Myxococcota bacterium]
MALQIINAGPNPNDVAAQIRSAIAQALPEARIEVRPQGPGHFEIYVTDAAFAGKPRVRQQQLVYGAIAHLMSGPNPPVHAVDRLDCRVP